MNYTHKAPEMEEGNYEFGIGLNVRQKTEIQSSLYSRTSLCWDTGVFFWPVEALQC